MGWGADALYEGRYIEYAPNAAELTAAFEAAAFEVGRLARSVDCLLSSGAIHGSGARTYIEEAIGRKPVDIFSPEEVREMVATTRWCDPNDLDPNFLSAFWSARKFLETRAELGLSAWME